MVVNVFHVRLTIAHSVTIRIISVTFVIEDITIRLMAAVFFVRWNVQVVILN